MFSNSQSLWIAQEPLKAQTTQDGLLCQEFVWFGLPKGGI